MIAVCALGPAATFASGAKGASSHGDYYVAVPEKAPDITAYNAALGINNVKAWNDFLKAYPTSLYCNSARIKRLQIIQSLYLEQSQGDGSFFDFHVPVRAITCRPFSTIELVELSFDREERVASSAFTRDGSGRINGYDQANAEKTNLPTFYSYDGSGRLTSYGTSKTSSTVQLKYNPYGLLNTEEIHEGSADAVKERHEYSYTQYDDRGNWTTRVCTVVKNSKVIRKETETRRLTYWE